MFPLPHLNTRGSWENSRQLCKPEMQLRVYITVKNSLNSPECLDEAMETWKKKSSIAFIKYFSKIIQQMKENAGFFYFLIETDFLDTHHIPYQPIKMRVWQHITNQSLFDVTAMFPYPHPNTAIDQ